jgi:hypothetical protein
MCGKTVAQSGPRGLFSLRGATTAIRTSISVSTKPGPRSTVVEWIREELVEKDRENVELEDRGKRNEEPVTARKRLLIRVFL